MDPQIHELNNVARSIHWRLWSVLVQQGWWIDQVAVPLVELKDKTLPSNTYGVVGGFPWVFLDEQNHVWPSGLKLYDSGAPVPSGQYVPDYLNARVTFTVPPSGDVTCDCRTFTARIVEGYPEREKLEAIELPIVAHQIHFDDDRPYGLGEFPKIHNRVIEITALTRSEGERGLLEGTLKRYAPWIPYLDLVDHQPLNPNGSLDFQFSFADQVREVLGVAKGQVHGELLEPPAEGSDKEKFRVMVVFEVENVS